MGVFPGYHPFRESYMWSIDLWVEGGKLKITSPSCYIIKQSSTTRILFVVAKINHSQSALSAFKPKQIATSFTSTPLSNQFTKTY